MLKCADGWRHMSPLPISSIAVSLWLAGCLAKSTLTGWREYYGRGGMGVDRHLCGAQQTQGFDPMLFQYWPTANGTGPTLKQHWVSLRVCWESCPHFDTGPIISLPSVSGWNRWHTALCSQVYAASHVPLSWSIGTLFLKVSPSNAGSM